MIEGLFKKKKKISIGLIPFFLRKKVGARKNELLRFWDFFHFYMLVLPTPFFWPFIEETRQRKRREKNRKEKKRFSQWTTCPLFSHHRFTSLSFVSFFRLQVIPRLLAGILREPYSIGIRSQTRISHETGPVTCLRRCSWSASRELTVCLCVHASLGMLCLRLSSVLIQCLSFVNIDIGHLLFKMPKPHQLGRCRREFGYFCRECERAEELLLPISPPWVRETQGIHHPNRLITS